MPRWQDYRSYFSGIMMRIVLTVVLLSISGIAADLAMFNGTFARNKAGLAGAGKNARHGDQKGR